VDSEARDASLDHVIGRWRTEVGRLPDVLSLSFTEPQPGPGGKPIDVRLMGGDLEELKAASTDLLAWLGGYRGVLAALEERGMMPVAIQFYRRNTVTVKNSLLDLIEANPEAVIIIGAYRPAAELILWARQVGFNPVYMTVSFVGADALAAELGTEGQGVFVTQVVPFPDNRGTPVVAAYLDALEAYDREAEPGFVSLEGYLAGRLAIEGLERCGRAVTRECLLDELLGADVIDIDGLRLTFTDADEDAPDATPDNQGSDDVFLTAIDSEGNLKEIAALNEAVP